MSKRRISISVVLLSLCFCVFPTKADEKKTIRYSEFGAVGDGKTDDFDAIIKAHAAANEKGLKVQADASATYYIAASNKTALVQTDTDWGDARFIIDDSNVDVKNRHNHIFNVSSRFPPIQITNVRKLRKNQAKLDLSLPRNAFVIVTDKTTKLFIRSGGNQNNGNDQMDVFLVDKNGRVDMKAPIIWDFDNITSMKAYPIDAETLTVRGGHFTTIANQAESKYTYYTRGICTTRSNVVIDGVTHVITGELDHGAPYDAFIAIKNASDVTVRNCMLSGHKIFKTIGNAKTTVSMGSYDISVNNSINVTFKNCKQINSIHDTKLWGIFGSNHSKNITFDFVEFSRFDAHRGVTNATIRNSVLGHQGINIIGNGVFLLENTKVCSVNFINLRGDYGSTFDGEFIIRNCEYVPRNGAKSDAVLVSASNSGRHDFGYPCSMPRKIIIDGLVIDDGNPVDHYKGPKIFSSFNNEYKDDAYVEKYPYAVTREVEIGNMTIRSGKPYVVSSNPFLFRNVKITKR